MAISNLERCLKLYLICLLIPLAVEKEEEEPDYKAMQSSSPDSFTNDLQSEPSSSLQSVTEDEESVNTSSPECSLSSYRPERRKQRRNPSVLVQWIEEHPFNPYPTKQEKQQLAVMSGMTLRQLNDWFANARRNIKKLGFELWRKKRNGLPSEKGLLGHRSCTCIIMVVF